MSDLQIDFEWLDPLGARGPELRATWARLSIVVAGKPVTRVYDERSKTVRDAVYLPLYPFAEWLAANWWALWNESAEHPGYHSRHSLVKAREGYALPPLLISPAGSLVTLSWDPQALPFHRLEFIGQGEYTAETRLVKKEFSLRVDTVVNRLKENGITDTLLQKDWMAIQSADPEEREFCQCAGSLGLDPYSLDDAQQKEIEDAGNLLPEEIVHEFFRAARAEELTAEAHEVHEAFRTAQRNKADLVSFIELRRIVGGWSAPPGIPPWNEGYFFAQQLRAHLGLNGRLVKSIEGVADALGTTEVNLKAALSSFPSRKIPFDALMAVNDRSSPAFVLRESHSSSELFRFCRALFEYLCSRDARSALITDVYTEQQKRNRAFAAELLAPASALRDRVKTDVITWDETEELAEEFGVASKIIEHQLENQCDVRVQQPWK